MAIQVQGNGGVVAEVGGTGFRALIISPKPVEYGALGAYHVHAQTGTLAAALAASAVVFSFRWSDVTRLALITSLRWRFLPLTPFTGATLTDHTSFDAYIGRIFSASHTGGTGVTLTGDNLKVRTAMGSSLVADIRIATTAALGGGTVTLAAQAFMQSIRKGNRVNPAAATEEVVMPATDGAEYEPRLGDGETPIVLAANEGIVIRNRTVWPAAGTGILIVGMRWAEVASF